MTVSSTLFLNKYKMDCALLTKICNFSTAEILDKSQGDYKEYMKCINDIERQVKVFPGWVGLAMRYGV